jgi:hypothetical protein
VFSDFEGVPKIGRLLVPAIEWINGHVKAGQKQLMAILASSKSGWKAMCCMLVFSGQAAEHFAGDRIPNFSPSRRLAKRTTL